jgi:acyl-CoA thioesterase FadM
MTTTLRIEPRWTDFDPLGHVNNSVFLVYAEEARARYLGAALPEIMGAGRRGEQLDRLPPPGRGERNT